MPTPRLAPTRANLLRARDQLLRIRKGASVVRRKRQALVAELFRAARPAVDARAAIEREVAEAYPSLLEALAVHGRAGLRALSWPERRVEVEIRPSQVWGVAVADVELITPVTRSLEARGTVPGSTGPSAMDAASHFETLTKQLLAAATMELRVSRLATAVSQSSQQLRVLEERLEPALQSQIARVRSTLQEREREEGLVVRHLKRRRS